MNSLQKSGANSDSRIFAKKAASPGRNARAETGVILHDTVVVQRSVRVNDTASTDRTGWIHDGPRHDDRSFTDFHIRRDRCARMDSGHKGKFRTEFLDLRCHLSARKVVPNCDDHTQECKPIHEVRKIPFGPQDGKTQGRFALLAIGICDSDDIPPTLTPRYVYDDFCMT